MPQWRSSHITTGKEAAVSVKALTSVLGLEQHILQFLQCTESHSWVLILASSTISVFSPPRLKHKRPNLVLFPFYFFCVSCSQSKWANQDADPAGERCLLAALMQIPAQTIFTAQSHTRHILWLTHSKLEMLPRFPLHTVRERSQPALGHWCHPGSYQLAESVAATLKMPKSLSISNPLPWAKPGKEMRDFPDWKLLEQPVQRQTYSARTWTGAKKNSSTFSSLSQLEHCIPIFVVVYYSLLLIQGLLKINIC